MPSSLRASNGTLALASGRRPFPLGGGSEFLYRAAAPLAGHETTVVLAAPLQMNCNETRRTRARWCPRPLNTPSSLCLHRSRALLCAGLFRSTELAVVVVGRRRSKWAPAVGSKLVAVLRNTLPSGQRATQAGQCCCLPACLQWRTE